MLPFLDERKMSGSIMAAHGKRGLDIPSEMDAPSSKVDPDLKEASADILRAIEDRSPIDLASAIKACWEICSSSGEDEYDDQGEE
jgi:hypothetical protein